LATPTTNRLAELLLPERLTTTNLSNGIAEAQRITRKGHNRGTNVLIFVPAARLVGSHMIAIGEFRNPVLTLFSDAEKI